MNWMDEIAKTIRYMEDHMAEEMTLEEIAAQANMSPFYCQKGFSILCGFTVSEYLRNRRLSLSARDLQSNGSKVIDVALKYGYDSPDSFTKAFTRFHGVTPAAVKNGEGTFRNFQPLRLVFSLKGGFEMDVKIVKKPAFTVVGFSRMIPMEEGYKECPKFWNEHFESGRGEVICGSYGICMDEGTPDGFFRYMIADDYNPEKKLPDNAEEIRIPEHTWAVFPCKGPMPSSLQDVNTRIFTEWLPANPDYQLAGGFNIEYYTSGNDYPKGTQDENYYSEIWIPVKSR